MLARRAAGGGGYAGAETVLVDVAQPEAISLGGGLHRFRGHVLVHTAPVALKPHRRRGFGVVALQNRLRLGVNQSGAGPALATATRRTREFARRSHRQIVTHQRGLGRTLPIALGPPGGDGPLEENRIRAVVKFSVIMRTTQKIGVVPRFDVVPGLRPSERNRVHAACVRLDRHVTWGRWRVEADAEIFFGNNIDPM